MAGHSKWANIKHKKKIKDNKKSKLFSKLISNIQNTFKSGLDIQNNSNLKSAINKALQNNISKNTIKNLTNKAIKKIDKNNTKLIYFSNSNILITIEILNNINVISEIKYILQKYKFLNIEIKKIKNVINHFKQITITSNYNEMLLFSKIKIFNILEFLDSKITININQKIKYVLQKNYNIIITLIIKYNKYITPSQKIKKNIKMLYTTLLNNNNIQNIFINII